MFILVHYMLLFFCPFPLHFLLRATQTLFFFFFFFYINKGYNTNHSLQGHIALESYGCGLVFRPEVLYLSVLVFCVCVFHTVSLKTSNSFCTSGTMIKAKSILYKMISIFVHVYTKYLIDYG